MSEAAEQIEFSRSRRFRPYPEYRDSGIEWLGKVPIDWQVRRLKLLLQKPLQYGANEPAELTDPNLPRYIRITDVGEDGRLREDTFRTIPEDVARPYLLEDGDLLFARSGATVGKTFRFEPSWGRAAHAGYLIRARLKSACNSRFVQYFTTSRGYWDWLRRNFIQATIQNVSADRYANLEVPLPQLREQRAIANFLDREAAKIDALVERKERLIELLQEKRTALITRAVTRGLDRNVPMQDSGIEWLGEIPAHWEVKRLWHLTPPERKIMYGIVLPGPNVDDGVPIVKGGDVAVSRLKLHALSKTTFEIESRYIRSRLVGGDLVYAIRGSIGEVEMVPDELEGANLTQDAARVAYTQTTHGHWLKYGLRSKVVLSQLAAGALGATIKGINIRDLKRALLPVPPRCEQERIASFLDTQTAHFSALSAKVQEAIDHLREFRTALISAAVSGKIDVREAMPG